MMLDPDCQGIPIFPFSLYLIFALIDVIFFNIVTILTLQCYYGFKMKCPLKAHVLNAWSSAVGVGRGNYGNGMLQE